MSGRMRKRTPNHPKVAVGFNKVLKGFHAPQKDNSRRQKRKFKQEFKQEDQ